MAASTKRSWKLQDFVAHGANVNCLALGHKSGRVLVTGGDDKKVNLWAVGTHNCIMSLGGHTTPVECVRFGHTDDLVCAGSQTGALKIWDLEAAKIVRTLTGHKLGIRCMDFHPYGDFLTSGSVDTSIKLWDIRRKGCIFTYKGHALTVNSLKFSPDGQWIASGGEDGLVKLWDLRAGRVLKEFTDHTESVTSVEFHPHEFLLASGSADRTVNFFDLENFQLVSTTDRDGGAISCLYFSQGGECLYAGSNDVLRVCGWEPARIHDTLNTSWGRVADIATAQNQLIGASFHITNVALFVVDLSKVQPFGGPVINDPVQLSPFRHGQSSRKSFSKETQLNLSKPPMSVRTIEESERSETDPEDDLSATIADIPDVNDYSAIFQPHRSLNRSPPPSPFPAPLDDVPQTPTTLNLTNSISAQEDIGLPQILQPQVPVAISPEPVEYYNASGGGDVEPLDSILHSGVKSELASPTETPLPRQRGSSQLSPVRQRADKQSGVIPPGPLRAPSGLAKSGLPVFQTQSSQGATPHAASATTSPNITPSSARRISFKEESLSSLENDFPVKLSSIRHSPSEPSLNRPNTNHNRSSSLNRNNVGTGNVKQSNDIPVTFVGKPPAPKAPVAETARRTSVDRRKPEPEPRADNENGKEDFIPMIADKPSGLDLEEFLTNRLQRSLNVYQPSYVDLSESEVISSLMRGHDPMMAVIAGRTRSLQIIYSLWHNKDLKVAVDAALEMHDQAIIVDLLGILNLRPSIWNLDLCVAFLSPINELLQSKYEMYMTVGCEALRLILRNFAPVIKTNVRAPDHSVGVDISREERYNKCLKCYESLLLIKSFLLKRQTLQGRLGTTFRELAIMMQALDN